MKYIVKNCPGLTNCYYRLCDGSTIWTNECYLKIGVKDLCRNKTGCTMKRLIALCQKNNKNKLCREILKFLQVEEVE